MLNVKCFELLKDKIYKCVNYNLYKSDFLPSKFDLQWFNWQKECGHVHIRTCNYKLQLWS